MIKITFSDEFGKSMDFKIDENSLTMISRFLHFISLADPSLYSDYSDIQIAVADFYDSKYSHSQIQDSKMLRCCIDYILGNLV